MCGDYQQMVHKFYCQGEGRLFESVDYQPSAEVRFVVIGSLGRAERMS